MNRDLPSREKWRLFLAGEDIGPMVSPLCDDWSLNIPYHWPFDEPEPFPPGHRWHAVSQQMAMAGVCGWDPTLLAGIEMTPRNADIAPHIITTEIDGGTRTETRIATPLGDITSIIEHKTTMHVVKHQLETEEDYRKMAWLVRQQMDYDEDAAIEQGRELREGIGDRGVLGTWSGPAIHRHENMFYHLADWPEAFSELADASRALVLRQLETLHKAGFDYLFYCVDGTEWISPDFFRTWVLDFTREVFARWRSLGGFILWHSCGQVARFIEAGFYNELEPDIFETMSEPPVGNLPSLRWGRERLDPAIATKGNMPLNILLHGTPDDVREEVRRIKAETAGWRHIVGLSDDVLKGTPLANARAFVEEARAT